jgi:hypothetical protein
MTDSDTSKYTWAQTDTEVTITMPVEREIKGKDIVFKLSPNSLVLGIKGQKPVIEGELFCLTKPDDSTWELDTVDGAQRAVKVLLFKRQEYRHWDCILKSELPKGTADDEDANAVKAMLREWPALKELDDDSMKRMAKLRPTILELNENTSRTELFRVLGEVNSISRNVSEDKKVLSSTSQVNF